MNTSKHFVSSLAILSGVVGCSLTIDVPPVVRGGAGQAGEAGGGADTSGGSKSRGGTSAKGGSTAKGGSSSKGGSAGANTNEGGASPSTLGGASSLGGSSSGGASVGLGGSSSGGTTAKGGSSSVSGGAPTTGGTTAKGGSTSAGGAVTVGGSAPSGGTTAKGGSTSAGGALTVGGSAAAGGSTATVPAPQITSLTVDYNKVCSGTTATLTAVFANGVGTIDNGVGTVTSGVAKTTAAISANTTFTLTVTNTAGVSVKSNPVTVTSLPSGQFTPTGSMTSGRYSHSAALLSDGRAVIVGGDVASSVEVYDLGSGVFTMLSNGPGQQLRIPSILPLPNLKAFISDFRSAWSFDAGLGTFTAADGGQISNDWRYDATATWLPSSGKVLIAGGCYDDYAASRKDTLIFDSTALLSISMTAGPSLGAARAMHTATLLPTSGKVLLVGGANGCEGTGISGLGSAEIYDPSAGASGSMTATAVPKYSRLWASAIALKSGKVLIAGGQAQVAGASLSAAEVFDPGLGANGQFDATGPMFYPRLNPGMVLLPSGNVFVVGGSSAATRAELYLPTTGTFKAVDAVLTNLDPTPVLLRNGAVLLTGGGNGTKNAYLYCE